MPSFLLEQNLKGSVVGLDEVGCGPWAGPVVAAAFVFLEYTTHPLLQLIKDSKILTDKARTKISLELYTLKGNFLDFEIAEAIVAEIDQLNIKRASMLAMERAYAALATRHTFAHALVDGITSPSLPIPLSTIVKGDDKSFSIAGASIVAKVFRDDLMANLAKQHPHYGWERNAGYGTKAHQEGLQSHGLTPWHRRSFKPIQALAQSHG